MRAVKGHVTQKRSCEVAILRLIGAHAVAAGKRQSSRTADISIRMPEKCEETGHRDVIERACQARLQCERLPPDGDLLLKRNDRLLVLILSLFRGDDRTVRGHRNYTSSFCPSGGRS